MQRFVPKFFSFYLMQNRKFGIESKKIPSSVKYVDKSKNIVYGGDLPVPTSSQSIGSVLFERLIKREKKNEILQMCTTTKYGVTTRKFVEQAVALSERLREEGIKKGDFIGLVGNNSLNMNTALAGIFFLGAVPFPISHKTSVDEFKIVLKNIRPKFFACDQVNLVTLQQVLKAIGGYDISRIFLLNDKEHSPISEAETFQNFIKGRGKDIHSFKPAGVDNPQDELALIMKGARHETYGKGIGITHFNLNSIIARFELNSAELENHVILMVQKVMWMSGIYCLLKACCFGSKLIVMSEFDEEGFMQAIEDYKVTFSYTYASKLWQLYKYNFSKEYDLSSCQYLQAFNGSLPECLISGMKKKFGLLLKPSYGINELSGLALQPTGISKESHVGELVPQMYGKVISDQTLHKAGPYEKGEICFKGPAVTKGYLNDPISNRKLFDKEGYLLTGTYGYYDNDGYFFILDNMRHVILYKNHEIFPRQLEGIIKSLEPVKDALVAGIRHPTDGFYPIAFVSLQKDATFTADEIIKYVNEKVADHEKLRGGVIFIPKIPRSRDTGALRRSLFAKVLSKYRLTSEVKPVEVSEKTKENEKPKDQQ